MEIAVLSDIHGNPLALENVLSEIEDVDLIVSLGDTVGIGPYPSEVIEMLMRDRRFAGVMGNHDHNTLEGTELGPIEEIPRKPHHDWVRSKLGPRHLEFLRRPVSLSLELGKEMLFMHRSIDDWWSKVPYFDDPSPGTMDDFYGNADGDILFFGHTHIPLDVYGSGGRRYINPGAVGAENGGKARFTRISASEGSEPEIVHHAAVYDKEWIREALKDEAPPYWDFIFKHFYGDRPAGSHR